MKNSDRHREAGTLYVVSTPIGNLEDITLRSLKVLGEVERIAAESVDHTRVLCERYGIKTRLTPYNQHNRKTRGPELLRRLKSGQDVALVTNAGAPGVSDPGVSLVRRS
jgi:16S rRNA (cytidine1402-2'-O)-methyltransferase